MKSESENPINIYFNFNWFSFFHYDQSQPHSHLVFWFHSAKQCSTQNHSNQLSHHISNIKAHPRRNAINYNLLSLLHEIDTKLINYSFWLIKGFVDSSSWYTYIDRRNIYVYNGSAVSNSISQGHQWMDNAN